MRLRQATAIVTVTVGLLLGLLTTPLSATVLTFVPMPVACRLLDTRPSIGQVPAFGLLNFHVRGDHGLGAGGQQDGDFGCGTSFLARVAVLNVTAVNPQSSGQVIVWAYGQPAPVTTATMNLVVGHTENEQLTVPLGGFFETFDVALFSVPSSHYTVDVVGYYVESD